MKFGCSFGIFLSSAHLICRSTDISKYFREALRLRDNESRLYINDVLYLKSSKTWEFIDLIYLCKLEIKGRAESNTSAS